MSARPSLRSAAKLAQRLGTPGVARGTGPVPVEADGLPEATARSTFGRRNDFT